MSPGPIRLLSLLASALLILGSGRARGQTSEPSGHKPHDEAKPKPSAPAHPKSPQAPSSPPAREPIQPQSGRVDIPSPRPPMRPMPGSGSPIPADPRQKPPRDDDDDPTIVVVPGPTVVIESAPVGLPFPVFMPGNDGGGGPFVGNGFIPQPRRPDPAKAASLVTVGDRLFRGGNYRKAAERYEQARRADPRSGRASVRLAQVALVHGDYKVAAARLRAATAAEPGWPAREDEEDIRALYAEPSDFGKSVAKLEAHLQASPKDRDGWLVLGAELFLSGETRKASDVFVRLNDRKPDPTLAALLDATAPSLRLETPPTPR